MRRTDRLFELVQVLRDGRLHRASDLAAAMGGVSVRTIWRDMATLMASGMPIEGERGVGYVLRAPTTLPPLMLTMAEMEALRDGLRRVSTAGDPGLARAARSLAAKIGAVAPAPQDPDEDDIFTFRPAATAVAEGLVPALRAAIRSGAWMWLFALDDQDRPQRDEVMVLRLTEDQGRRVLVVRRKAGRGEARYPLDRLLAIEPLAV
ncbi:MAG: HTH domain-containing protein [Rhodobacteraceae bacterium]|nr:HTH domain-containing protein [Paracoccaceae bacterium]